jgi:hypothetical protein
MAQLVSVLLKHTVLDNLINIAGDTLHGGDESEMLLNSEFIINNISLVADTYLGVHLGSLGDANTINEDGTCIQSLDTTDAIDESGFTGTIVPEETEHNIISNIK